MTEVPSQELLSLEEAAEFLCVSKSTMYRLLDLRKLAGMKAGKQWRFRRDDLLTYMRRGPAAQALAKVSAPVVEEELAFFATALAAHGIAAADADGPASEGEEGLMTRLIYRMVRLLWAERGSDLHLNPTWGPEGRCVLLLLRVDGRLREVRRLPFALLDALVAEWKRQTGLQIEEHARPQDGSARLEYGPDLLSLRVAVVPTVHGEKVTARLVPTQVPTLAMLGLDETPLVEWSHRERGLLLVVGPTGSGKTTTRAALMQAVLDHRACNIMAVEDPVEYLFPRDVTHLKVEGFTTAEGVRTVLRHDPDVIVIGALDGDLETARLAVEAAETGHLVLSCLHASDAIAPLYDLLDLGVKRQYLANTLIAVVHQQLAPRLCTACRTPAEVEPALRERIRRVLEESGGRLSDDAVFYRQAGCPQCKGRVALHEYFTFTPSLRATFLRGAPLDELTRLARAEGHSSFAAARVQAAMDGRISLDTLAQGLPE